MKESEKDSIEIEIGNQQSELDLLEHMGKVHEIWGTLGDRERKED